jgi:DNA uptake protein ComE-like DNA-binding protein
VFTQKKNVDFSAFRKDIAKFEKSLKEKEDEKQDSLIFKEFDYNNIDRSVAENILHPFNFNPNNLPTKKWKEMGLSDKQIKIIKKFEAKGGKFFKKEDLKKIYGITESDYTVLEPYIQIPDKNKTFDKKEKVIYKNDKNTEIIELNSADTIDLKKLKGIGYWYAKKILAYRNKLGGFYKKEQLMEVKGIDSSRYAGFISYVSVNPFRITTININTASFDELKSHPYMGYNIALSLINIRNVHGKFVSVADIKKSALITDKIYEKISPYLTVN